MGGALHTVRAVKRNGNGGRMIEACSPTAQQRAGPRHAADGRWPDGIGWPAHAGGRERIDRTGLLVRLYRTRLYSCTAVQYEQ
jgi:hypothetical protein